MADEEMGARLQALEDAVAGLNARVRAAEADAAAARVLASGADRDTGEMRSELRDFRAATIASFNAHREDLADLRATMREGFATTAAGQTQIVSLLTALMEGDSGRTGE